MEVNCSFDAGHERGPKVTGRKDSEKNFDADTYKETCKYSLSTIDSW